ncbi:MAG: CotH kinase family protein, partial [Calditrichia bacterium]|nr:CotH kinase family protein [Calditrichia bacterium]
MKFFTLQLLILLLLSFSINAQESWKLYDDSQVAVVEITVAPEDLVWMYQGENLESDSLHLASVHFSNAYIDETIDSVGFRLRGNTSRYSQKKSFKLSFNKFVSGREFYGVDKMNLNGEHNDPSIIRSKLCWDIFQKIGITASRAAHAEVYINDEYYGLYISVEHIDDEFLQKNFTDDSGNLWKCLWPADLAIIGSGNPEDYHPDAEGRPYELRTNEEEYDYSQLARFISIINNTPDELLADSLEKILNVPDVIKYFAIDVLTGSWDDYWFLKNNYYLYHMPSEDKFHLIPYDYDNTFSIDWFEKDWAIINPYQFGSDESRPLADRILANAQYRDLFTHFLQFYSENVLELSLWETRIDSLKDMITTFAENDTYRTLDYGFTIDDFHNSYSSSSYYNQHVKRGLKEFINERDISIDGQLSWVYGSPIVYNISNQPALPQPTDSIYVTASAFSYAGLDTVEIHLLTDNSEDTLIYLMNYNPVVQTNRVEEADRWTGVIPPLGENGSGKFKIVVKDIFGLTQSYPRTSYIQVQASGE